ncbi:helix-turn-helix domain-containing protein [Streptomyces sp. KR55]|uniref:helix-turn-helix domain-containing protein n=1 Tax=Streptomyces sp. KR55 TaxID=3457425 RepID=UPI003FD67110
MIEMSWSGLRVPAIAAELGCSQKTVRCWLHRFNRSGLPGPDDLGGQGRKRRITEEERSRIISLVKTVPPGRLRWEPVGELWAFDESGPPEWTLDALAPPGVPCPMQQEQSRGPETPSATKSPLPDQSERPGAQRRSCGSSCVVGHHVQRDVQYLWRGWPADVVQRWRRVGLRGQGRGRVARAELAEGGLRPARYSGWSYVRSLLLMRAALNPAHLNCLNCTTKPRLSGLNW